jgi:DNA-binding beta-propeller fold protein YncE
VATLHPGSDAVPASIYFGGEAARLGGRTPQALERFSRVATVYPASPWAANALLGSAATLVRGNQPARAMEQLQRIRNQFPRTPEAATALDWNSVLYRLYLRAPQQPAFVFSGRSVGGPAGKLRDVIHIGVDGENNVFVANNTGVTAYGTKGNQTFSVSAPEPRSVTFDRLGKIMTVHELGIRAEGKNPLPLIMPIIEGRGRELKLEAAVMTATGDILAADRDAKAILRFSPDGRYVGEYAVQINVLRMAINDLDEVVALDRDSKDVTIFDRDGKVVKKILDRGPGDEFRNPADVQFDRLGHIYVLGRTTVHVFSPDGAKLLATFTPAEKTPGAIGEGKALALDRAGRPHVFDGRTDTVKVYR